MTWRAGPIVLAFLLCIGACGGGDGDPDGGGGGAMDSGGTMDATPSTDAPTPLRDGECIPTVEICGDRIDQNCDGRDTSCGDTDRDGIEACRAGDDLTMCDCDDSRADVYPPFGTVPGASELCDGRDNDCDGRVDESAECCEGCAYLGAERSRGDVCLPSGVCDCSTQAGEGVCPAGYRCCSSGCVDANTDINHCGLCNAACTNQADRCVGGECRCGAGPACEFINECTSGSCG